MNSEQIIQEATEAVEKGLPCAFLVPHLLEVAKNQKSEIDILIRKKEALRDEIAEKDAEIERLKNAYKQCAWERDVFSKDANAIKSEAYREFAERFKSYVTTAERKPSTSLSYSSLGIVNMIDHVYRELTKKNDKG